MEIAEHRMMTVQCFARVVEQSEKEEQEVIKISSGSKILIIVIRMKFLGRFQFRERKKEN